jgi:hypothetical protein
VLKFSFNKQILFAMKKKPIGNILANTKILNDKTYQDFNKEAPDPKDPVQIEATEIAEAVEERTIIDENTAPQVGARDKNINN